MDKKRTSYKVYERKKYFSLNFWVINFQTLILPYLQELDAFEYEEITASPNHARSLSIVVCILILLSHMFTNDSF